VLGSRTLNKPPETSNTATIKIGTAHDNSMKYPKTTLPKIAPSLATAKVTAMAVDLTFVGKSSIPKQSNELNPITDTNPKAHDKSKLAIWDVTK